jgi:hypothetical protein
VKQQETNTRAGSDSSGREPIKCEDFEFKPRYYQKKKNKKKTNPTSMPMKITKWWRIHGYENKKPW